MAAPDSWPRLGPGSQPLQKVENYKTTKTQLMSSRAVGSKSGTLITNPGCSSPSKRRRRSAGPLKKEQVKAMLPVLLFQELPSCSVGTGKTDRGKNVLQFFSKSKHRAATGIELGPLLQLLSNFDPVNDGKGFLYKGEKYLAGEHAFQAAKFENLNEDLPKEQVDKLKHKFTVEGGEFTDGKAAKSAGTKGAYTKLGVSLNIKEWEAKRLKVMTELVQARFEQDPVFRQIVTALNKAGIKIKHFERSGAKSFWGGNFSKQTGEWRGGNHLGKILMSLGDGDATKSQLPASSQETSKSAETKKQLLLFPAESIGGLRATELDPVAYAKSILAQEYPQLSLDHYSFEFRQLSQEFYAIVIIQENDSALPLADNDRFNRICGEALGKQRGPVVVYKAKNANADKVEWQSMDDRSCQEWLARLRRISARILRKRATFGDFLQKEKIGIIAPPSNESDHGDEGSVSDENFDPHDCWGGAVFCHEPSAEQKQTILLRQPISDQSAGDSKLQDTDHSAKKQRVVGPSSGQSSKDSKDTPNKRQKKKNAIAAIFYVNDDPVYDFDSRTQDEFIIEEFKEENSLLDLFEAIHLNRKITKENFSLSFNSKSPIAAALYKFLQGDKFLSPDLLGEVNASLKYKALVYRTKPISTPKQLMDLFSEVIPSVKDNVEMLDETIEGVVETSCAPKRWTKFHIQD